MNILGISCYYHDSAAALIINGKVIAAAEEERFSRIKHDSSFPHQAIDFVMAFGKLSPKQIDYVVFYEKPFSKFERINFSLLEYAPFTRNNFIDAYKHWLKQKLWIKSDIVSSLKISSEKILFIEHHLAHAASSYYTSNFSSSAILTCDGVGEWATTTWGMATNKKLYLKEQLNFPNSLGLFYSTFTQFLGFEINEGEFKVMGLSPYGKPLYVEKIGKLITQADDGSFELNLKYFNFHISDKVTFNQHFVDLFGVAPMDPKQSDKISTVYADIAASAQQVLEEKLLKLAKVIRKNTNEENLCIGGGVALNGVANWRIFKEAGFKNIFVHPAAGDSGGAVGAALYVYHHVLNNPRTNTFESVYLGAENSSDNVKIFLKSQNIKAKSCTEDDLTDQVATLLSKKKVVGWVRGRFEWGPRALGARSILADPRDKKMKNLVNSKIKFREGFRPFAPVTLFDRGSEYFDTGQKDPPRLLEYMLAVVPVKKNQQEKLGAVTHVDGTARPQFIKPEKNPTYAKVISKFCNLTGIPVLLNTSFNLKGEPIVNTYQHAYSTFKRSGLDVLVLENFLILK